MDRSAYARKRRQDAPQPATAPTTQVLRNKRAVQQTQEEQRPQSSGRVLQSHNVIAGAQEPRSHSGKIRRAKDSSEIIRAKWTDDATGEQGGEDSHAKHFTVGNVGSGGTLFLKPSRLPPQRYHRPPATPPDTSEGLESVRASTRTVWPTGRTSDMSFAGWNPRAKTSYDHSVPVPPVSLANAQQKRRPRSHSFSTISERGHAEAPNQLSTEVQDFQFLLNGRDSNHPRPKSSLDLGDGLLNLNIPHYRLGTPRFSARGTAYLHNSMYTNTTEDMNSSVFSRAEFDKLFPAPPTKNARGPHRSWLSTAVSSPNLGSSRAPSEASARTPPTPSLSTTGSREISTAVYDKIEANPNDPSIVRYSPQTGRIVAATTARLIAQITSPRFLDYELLSDFFLTFRDFLSCRELLEYLLARMKWALNNPSDAGRIVRVRAFVSLRHWILNYFSDDFLMDFDLRKRFCDATNQMCAELKQRPDKGGGDLNILGELKKCWRRTCALFWQMSGSMNASPDTNIEPGGGPGNNAYAGSSISLPLTVRQDPLGDSNRAALAPQVSSQAGRKSPLAQQVMTNPPESPKNRARKASMPTSPMSEQSMHILSCSVPFLRNVCPPGPAGKHESRTIPPRPVGSARNPPVSLDQAQPSHQHKRSGSFSDALRDERTPLPSAKADGGDVRDSDHVTFTGGLVRGLVLQPCPASIDVPAILTPSEEPAKPRIMPMDEQLMLDTYSNQHLGVKRIVGDMRRALSNRKTPGDSPAPTERSGSSSGEKSLHPPAEFTPQKPVTKTVWQQPRMLGRVDLLNATIEDSYKDVYRDVVAQNTAEEARRMQNSQHDSGQAESIVDRRPEMQRLASNITTSSQSIMIVDATQPPELPPINRALPSVSSWSTNMTPAPLFPNPSDALQDTGEQDYFTGPHGRRYVKQDQPPHHEPSPNEYEGYEDDWRMTASSDPHRLGLPAESRNARASSGVVSPGLELPPIRHQLRRRPGGDLKAADNVRELEFESRPHSAGTNSTFSRSVTVSGPASREMSGNHFSGLDTVAQMTALRSPTQARASFGLLETPEQPYMRKSLGEDASRLATLPDESPGGIEDALLKLEGKNGGRRASTTAMFRSSRDTFLESGVDKTPSLRRPDGTGIHEEDEEVPRSPTTDRQGASIYHLSASDIFTDYNMRYSRSEFTDERSIAPVLPRMSNTTRYPIQEAESEKSSPRNVAFADVPSKVAVKHGAPEDNSEPKSAASQGSFLLDDDESLSEISTELGDQTEEVNYGVRSFFFDDTVEEEGIALQTFRPPPTPPSTVGAAPSQSPERHKQQPKHSLDAPRQLKEAASAPKILHTQLSKQTPPPSLSQTTLRRVRTTPEHDTPSHLPFVLSVDSAVIAEQLTIIEKDALDEIDWKDLIGLNWAHTAPQPRNWVTYLQSASSTNGIDLVIARFNLVVKWVVSECLLTTLPSERARTITKFIHVASHTLRLRNYASTYQITLALLSSDLERLHRTWALVAPSDKATLTRLEHLCHPVRNFAALRADMEASSLEHGCIPFIGLYTHDLTYNAQKPAHINAAPPGHVGQEVLVNFERYQTAAGIAKGLLRLLEASGRFVLRAEPQCLSRCLWLAALSDEEIGERSRGLE